MLFGVVGSIPNYESANLGLSPILGSQPAAHPAYPPFFRVGR